jgi:hypothetical protein
MRIKRIPVTLPLVFATDDNEITVSVGDLNGKLLGIIPVIPDLTSTHSVTVTIFDAGGYKIYEKAGIAESTSVGLFVDANNHPLQLPLSGAHTVKITTSGAQDANRTFTVYLLVESYIEN